MSKPSGANSLIGFLRHESLSLAVTVLLALTTHFLEYQGLLAGPEGWIIDAYSRVRQALAWPVQKSTPIATVEIDDAAYAECFGEESPLATYPLEELLKRVVDAGPRIVGIDIITDAKRRDYTNLRRQALAHSGTAIVWAAGATAMNVQAQPFFSWLSGAHETMTAQPTGVLGLPADDPGNALIHWSLPIFPRDEDLRVRRFPSRIKVAYGPDRVQEENTWAGEIGRRYAALSQKPRQDQDVHRGEQAHDGTHEVLISYAMKGPERFGVLDLLRCRADSKTNSSRRLAISDGPRLDEFRNFVKNRSIVLVGGTFGAGRDSHETALGRRPGLVINAYAVQAEINGSGIRETPRYILVVLDIAIGWLMVFLFRGEGQKMWPMIGMSILVVAVVAAMSFGWFLANVIWLSCVGVAFGTMLEIVVEVFVKNPVVLSHST